MRWGCRFLVMCAAVLWGLPAFGLNRVTLRNGFSYDCVDQQPVDAAHTRLFLSAAPEASYVDVPTAEIATVDRLPNPIPMLNSASSVGPAKTTDMASLLASAGSIHNIDVALLASIVQAESGGRVRAVSRAGAQGLMQLMPGTAHQMGVGNSFEPEQNINGGTAYLDALLTRYHNQLALALAAYNAGPAAVDRYGGVPPYRETQAYVARVMTEFKREKQALQRRVPASLQAAR